MQVSDFIRIADSASYQRKFGETHFVKHKETGEKGVLKLIRKDTVSAEMLTYLKQEAFLSFEEKGLPEILCVFENETYFSFVKRFQEGIAWKTYCNTLSDKSFYAHLPLALAQIIDVLHKVHEKGFIHGDIKPSNILIQANSPTDFQMELIDFGMSFPIGFIPNDKLPFSLGFAPPELLLNRLDLADETTDFFALGITMYNVITNEIPLAHPNPELFINLQLTHPILRNSKIPQSVFEIIAQMTQKPSFKLPPNQIANEELNLLVRESMAKRLKYSALRDAFANLKIKKTLFGFR